MAEFTFKWPAGPKDVIITGDFDNWKGTMPLVKSPKGDFSLTMPIEQTSNDKFHFKFIVDGEWKLSNSYDKEAAADGIENNYLVISSLPSYGSKNVGGAKIPEIGMGLVAPEVAAPVLGNQGPQKAQPAPGSKGKKGKKKKVQVKRRIRKNKKTGEKTVISEERFEIKSGAEDEYETEETATATGTSREETPLSSSAVPEATNKENEPSTTVMPSTENKQTTLGEPGVVIVPNPTEVKEFSEIRDVDAKELNEKLNREIREKQKKGATESAAAVATAAAVAAPAAAEAELLEKSTSVNGAPAPDAVEPLAAIEGEPAPVPGSITTKARNADLKEAEATESKVVAGESESALPTATKEPEASSSAVIPVNEEKGLIPVSDVEKEIVPLEQEPELPSDEPITGQEPTSTTEPVPAVVETAAVTENIPALKEIPADAKTDEAVVNAPLEQQPEEVSEEKPAKKDAPIVTEEFGQITSPEQEKELIKKTLDPKAPGVEELLIVEGNFSPSQVAEIQAASEKVADQAMANEKPETTYATEDEIVKSLEKPTESAPENSSKPQEASHTTKEKTKTSAAKTKPASTPASKPEEKKKKKKGFFSKLKKIFN